MQFFHLYNVHLYLYQRTFHKFGPKWSKPLHSFYPHNKDFVHGELDDAENSFIAWFLKRYNNEMNLWHIHEIVQSISKAINQLSMDPKLIKQIQTLMCYEKFGGNSNDGHWKVKRPCKISLE